MNGKSWHGGEERVVTIPKKKKKKRWGPDTGIRKSADPQGSWKREKRTQRKRKRKPSKRTGD